MPWRSQIGVRHVVIEEGEGLFQQSIIVGRRVSLRRGRATFLCHSMGRHAQSVAQHSH